MTEKSVPPEVEAYVKHTIKNVDEFMKNAKEKKEKSVLTDSEERSIYKTCLNEAQSKSEAIDMAMEMTEQKVLAKLLEKKYCEVCNKEVDTGMCCVDCFQKANKEALANYKKELREKVQERLDLIKEDTDMKFRAVDFRAGQETVFEWILRELRGD